MNIQTIPLWITDPEVRGIFSRTNIFYKTVNGYEIKQGLGSYVREERTNDGTLGYVFRCPFTGELWIWAIHRKTRKPFKLARLRR